MRTFQCKGIRAEAFCSAEEYLERTVPGAPRCLVLDVHLRGLSGIQLRERSAYPIDIRFDEERVIVKCT